MFEKLKWGHKYETGVKDIDLQHHYFMELINRIAEELKQPYPELYRKRLIEELAKYAVFHFLSEENLMIKYEYPDFDQHFRIHRELIDKLNSHAYLDTADEFLGFLVDWFLHHTVDEDKKIGQHILGHSNNTVPTQG